MDGEAVSGLFPCVIPIHPPLVSLVHSLNPSRNVTPGWAKNVTDICLPSLPLIQIPLDEIYLKRHFVLDGKAYKCHPDLGDKSGKISDEEQRRIKGLIEREKKEKKRGWESPIYT